MEDRLNKCNKVEIKKSISQEQHHSMHALTFFYMVIHKTLKGEYVGRRLIGRIIHHLMDLREFIDDRALTDLVNILLASLQFEYDRSLGAFVRMVHRGVKAVAGSRATSFLIASSEEEKQPTICMYPWLASNQDKILELANHYCKEPIFKGLIPLPVFGLGSSGNFERDE